MRKSLIIAGVLILLGSLGINVMLVRFAIEDQRAHESEKTAMVCQDHTGRITSGRDWMYCQTAHIRPARGKDWYVR